MKRESFFNLFANRLFVCKLMALSLICTVFVSCSETESSNIEYIPFQETEDGLWGMISMDGEVLFKDEFENEPTVVRDGRFFVRNKEGIWEMYEATQKPKKIGVDYVHVSNFQNGRAIVTVKDQPVSIIDVNGKEIKTLDQIDGKEIDGVRPFHGNYAIFMTSDSLFGVIDDDGKCVIRPDYCFLSNCFDGKFLGVNKKYKNEYNDYERNKYKMSVIDTKGKILFEFTRDKYKNLLNAYSDGKLAVSVDRKGEECWGIIDEKGEFVVKPSAKLKGIGTISGNLFTYYNGSGWGLMDINGKTKIRAKYETLYFAGNDVLVAYVKNGDNYEYKYVDEEDNQIGEDTYVDATPFSKFDGKHAFVKVDDKMYSIIDNDCNQLDGLPDIVNIGHVGLHGDIDTYIESDYVDLEKVVASFNVSPEGIMDLTFTSSPQDVVELQVKFGAASSSDQHEAGAPYWYDYTSAIQIPKDVNGVKCLMIITFPNNLSRQTYRTEKVVDYTYGNMSWYHNEEIPTGYVWNEINPDVFGLVISDSGRMKGKLKSAYKVLCRKFKENGTVEKENDSAAVIRLNNGGGALVRIEKDRVYVIWGDTYETFEGMYTNECENAADGDDSDRNHSYTDYTDDEVVGSVVADESYYDDEYDY